MAAGGDADGVHKVTLMLSADDEGLIERVLIGRLVQAFKQPINKSQTVRIALQALAG